MPSFLQIGMIVRFPYSKDEREQARTDDFRDYRIGSITQLNAQTETVEIRFQTAEGLQKVEHPIHNIHRAWILPDTTVTLLPDKTQGTVLMNCGIPTADDYADYFILTGGQVRRVREDALAFPSHRQDTDPLGQLRRYELHNPEWKKHRDVFVQSYSTLKSETFGLEDLINTRVLLMAHQAEVIARVLSTTHGRFILGDEVGLGKTIEASVILRGLRRRYGDFKTLLVVPAALARQWWNELDSKFWLEFAPWRYFAENPRANFTHPGLLVTTEQLETDKALAKFIQARSWGLLIVDEAHHISKSATLHRALIDISQRAQRALILSATPIQQRAEELFDLLLLMDPDHYHRMGAEGFHRLLEHQRPIRELIVLHLDTLTPDLFDGEGFHESLQELAEKLSQDRVLADFSAGFSLSVPLTEQLEAARAILTYLSENYRVESRMIRNRRASLVREILPYRTVSLAYAYDPTEIEQTALAEVIDYVQTLCQVDATPLMCEWARLILAAAASSPHAAIHLIDLRAKALAQKSKPVGDDVQLLRPAAPTQEPNRIEQIAARVAPFTGESDSLRRLIPALNRWKATEEDRAKDLAILKPSPHHRVHQIVQAIDDWLKREPAVKLVLFTMWGETLSWLADILRARYGAQSVLRFHIGMESAALNESIDKFQEADERVFLLCDELGGEGRNLQIADAIIHIDIPWTPAQIEQRIGRVDRLGRKGEVQSIIPYAKDEVESDLFVLWNTIFELFSKTVSGMEIALEDVQNQLRFALRENPRIGIAQLHKRLEPTLRSLRRVVDEERALERAAVNDIRRSAFRRVSEKFATGEEFRRAALGWATLAGLTYHYDDSKDEATFFPRKFNFKSMANAKYQAPNMQDAHRRSQRENTLEIRGTFNRSIAVRRERLVFLAPGETWTDSIIANALEADRGRSAAAMIYADGLDQLWRGFEFFYTINVNPQPLYEAGLDPIHLHQAQGFLGVSTHRVFISTEGEIMKRTHPAVNAIVTLPHHLKPFHLGKRDNGMIDRFRTEFPPDIWHAMIDACSQAAYQRVTEEFDFMQDEAKYARQTFTRYIAGERAALLWMNDGLLDAESQAKLDKTAQVAETLALGIEHPLIRLESVCFWAVHPSQEA